MKLTIVKGKIKAESSGIIRTFIITAGCLAAIFMLGHDAVIPVIMVVVLTLILRLVSIAIESEV